MSVPLIDRLQWFIDEHFPHILKYIDDKTNTQDYLNDDDLQELNSNYYPTKTIILTGLPVYGHHPEWNGPIEFSSPDGNNMNQYQLLVGINDFFRMQEQLNGYPVGSRDGVVIERITHDKDNIYHVTIDYSGGITSME